MRTNRGFRALDNDDAPLTLEAGMHNAYDADGNARYCPCSEFWASNPDPSVYLAHEDYSSTAYMTHAQIFYAAQAKQEAVERHAGLVEGGAS